MYPYTTWIHSSFGPFDFIRVSIWPTCDVPFTCFFSPSLSLALCLLSSYSLLSAHWLFVLFCSVLFSLYVSQEKWASLPANSCTQSERTFQRTRRLVHSYTCNLYLLHSHLSMQRASEQFSPASLSRTTCSSSVQLSHVTFSPSFPTLLPRSSKSWMPQSTMSLRTWCDILLVAIIVISGKAFPLISYANILICQVIQPPPCFLSSYSFMPLPFINGNFNWSQCHLRA